MRQASKVILLLNSITPKTLVNMFFTKKRTGDNPVQKEQSGHGSLVQAAGYLVNIV